MNKRSLISRFRSKIMVQNQKGFFQLLFIFILLTGIGIAVYLTQFTQIFKPKAAENTVIPTFEADYNPYGDPWNTIFGPNPDIPVALTTGCYRRGPKWDGRETDPLVSDLEIDYLAKSNVPVIFEECAIVQRGTGLNKQRLINIGTKLKQKNPNAKYIGYFVFHAPDFSGMGFGDIPQGAENGWDCGSVKCETFFIHKKGLPPTKENRFVSNGYQYLDVTNPYYRQYIVPKVAQALNELNMDGFLADGITETVPAGADSSQIPDQIKNTWGISQMDLFRDVKAAIGPNKLLFANTSNQNQEFIQAVLSNEAGTGLPRADGIMWEDPIGRIDSDINRLHPEGATQLEAIKSVLNIVSGLNKYMMFVVNTNVNCTAPAGSPADYCFKNTNKQKELQYQRYYLAGFLNLFKNNKTFLNYYTPIKTGPQFDAETFFKDWNTKIGQPLNISEEISPGVYLRKFQNAFVYWNTGNSPYPIHFGACCSLITLEGIRVEDYTLPAKSGMIFGGSAAFTSPSPSPQKPGNTDNDNDVDIFDYNLVLQDFGKTNDPNTRGDLDDDNDVDIFDYNIVLTNFGK